MEDIIKTLKALCDETRLRIMKVLLERECCVCEVMQALDIFQSRASRNLGILQDAGFLTARREGTWIIYSIDRDSANHYAQSLTKMLEKLSLDNEILAQDKERLKNAARVGPGYVRNHRLSRK
ncbi:MAG: winged helix-turn-helix transcriptional regulator [Dehalococcoidales bacterium]|nr:winged helix-turn-helix transcriptional regulator [Dehalococcoidales bacterium]